MSRLYQYPEVTELQENDVMMIDREGNETAKSILASKVAPALMSKTITERGTYKASDDGVRGYNEVNVDIPYTDIHVATGPIATFEGEDLPLKSLTASIVPVQDLHGYDSPWAGGAGKNKFNCTATTQTKNQVTFTINNDGTVSLSGTASATASVLIGTITLSAGTYILSGGVADDIYLNIQIPVYYSKTSETQFTVESETTFSMYATVAQGANATGKVLKPMIRLASVTDATFAPYSNICPISGWTGCEVVDDAVYGGFIDWNQLVRNGNFESISGWSVSGGSISISNNTATITISNESTEGLLYRTDLVCPATHKFIFICDFKFNGVQAHTNISGYTSGWQSSIGTVPTKSYGNIEYAFFTPSSRNLNILYIYKQNVQSGDILAYKNIMVIDLTQMFGSTKADEIYAMEQAEAGSGVAYFKSLFYKDYYPYNSGEITNVSAVNGDTNKYTTTTIPFTDSQGQSVEVFGGSVDVVNGGGSDTDDVITFSDLTYWAKSQTVNRFQVPLTNALKFPNLYSGGIADISCEIYKTVGGDYGYEGTYDYAISGSYWNGTNYLQINDSRFNTIEDLLSAIGSYKIRFKKATPTTFYTQPTSIKSLDGENNVFASTGDVDVEYQTVWVRPTE